LSTRGNNFSLSPVFLLPLPWAKEYRGEGETLPALRQNGHCEFKGISELVAGKKFIPLKTARNHVTSRSPRWVHGEVLVFILRL